MVGRWIIPRGVLAVLTAAIAIATAGAPSAGATEPMLVQSDGKIVLAGRLWPAFAGLARLNPDGKPDPSFGVGGFVVDRRLPPLTALALQPDGRIVGGGVGGFRLARYLPDGEPDPSFAGGGVGGTAVPGQSEFTYLDYGPNAIVLQPGGEIVVAGTESMGAGVSRGLVRRYDGNGQLLETTGSIPQLNGSGLFESHLDGLVANPDGSVTGTGWTYDFSNSEKGSKILLARFVPGAGTEYDPGFGGGAGLVRESFETGDYTPTHGSAMALDGDQLLVAGLTGGALMISRFGRDGVLDKSFGKGGFAAPPVPGAAPPSWAMASSWANDVAATGGGASVVAGGSSAWSKWEATKNGVFCKECPQPLLARFTSDGQLDPGFGEGGVLRLRKPDGGLFEGDAEQVAVLGDGKLLVKGIAPNRESFGGASAPFVARLNADGSYDPSFGEGGLTVLTFPCLDPSPAQLRREGCLPSVRARVRLGGLRRARPTLSLRVSPNLPWAQVKSVVLDLPPRLRLRKGFEARTRIVPVGGEEDEGSVHRWTSTTGRLKLHLRFDDFGHAQELRVKLRPGTLRAVGRVDRRRLVFGVSAQFVHGEESYAGEQSVTLRLGQAGG